MIDKIIAIYLLLLPYDHFPISISGSSRPVSFAFLLIIIIFRAFSLSKKYSLNNSVKTLSIFLIFTIFLTLIQGVFLNYYEMKETSSDIVALKGLLSVAIFFLGYELIYYYVNSYKRYIYVVRILVFSLILPVSIGLIHLISFIPSLNFLSNIVESITRIFVAERGDDNFLIDRVSMLTLEPSWAAQQLIIMFIPIIVISRNILFKSEIMYLISLFLSIIVLFGTASGLVALWLIIMFSFFSFKEIARILAKYKISLKYIKVLILCVSILFLLTIFVSDFFEYQAIKVTKLIEGGLASEPSTAIRLYNPIIGLNVFIGENPLFGIGLSMFGFYMPIYSPSWYGALGEGIAMSSFFDPYFGSPRNMYVKLLVETGVIGFTLFSIWFYRIIASLKYIKKFGSHNEYLGFTLVIIGILTSYINFDSLANLYIPTLLALIKVRSEMLKHKYLISLSYITK
jgi:hypothetical protein